MRLGTSATLWKPLTVLVCLSLLIAPTVLAGGDGETDSEVNVNNAAPAIDSIVVNGGAAVTPSAGEDVDVTIELAFSDDNGANDLNEADVEIQDSNTQTFDSFLLDLGSACPVADGDSSRVECTRTLTFPHDAPSGTYTVLVDVNDANGASTDNDDAPTTFTVDSTVAISIDTAKIDFGGLSPGTLSDIVGTSVSNTGNVEIDVQVDGTDLQHGSGSASIPVDRVTYGQVADLSDGAALSGSPATMANFDLPPGDSSSKSLYWQLDVPNGDEQPVPKGTYTGTVTIAAVAS